jgi:hypothetical protein
MNIVGETFFYGTTEKQRKNAAPGPAPPVKAVRNGLMV